MQLSDGDVRHCLEKAAELTEQYKLYSLAAGQKQRSVDDLEWLCGEYLGKNVSVLDLQLAADELAIRGMFAALSDGSYEIYLLADLGERERRFVKCKELFHVVLDDENCRSMDIYAHLELASVAFSVAGANDNPGSPVACEALAEIAAMEFLFPYAERAEVVANSAGNIDYPAVATQYGIPQLYVELYLSDPMMTEFAKVA